MNLSSNKVVINKSKKASLHSSFSPIAGSFSPTKKPANNPEQHRLETMRKEIDFHRQKNEQSLVKVKFLKNKLLFYGEDQIPEAIVQETSNIDERIGKLEKLLLFKQSQQMEKLKQKMREFLSKIEFSVEADSIEQFDDEVELMLFLVDVFGERYQELMKEIY